MKPEQVNAVDLVINVLRQHEEKLDRLVDDLEHFLRILEGKHMKELDRALGRLEKAVIHLEELGR